MKRDAATQAQVDAATPLRSTWLSANAGSGKTRVLTDRVARLLLEGVQPQHILCLTYTKAAAGEMQNRLFQRLGEWAMLPQDKLRTALARLGVDGTPSDESLRRARTLFARAIEAPGGLKIQTIHSFCSALLRRFPLEAQVSPQFKEMDDRAGELLRAEIVQEIARSPDRTVLDRLAQHFSGDDFETLASAVAQQRDGFAAPLTLDELLTKLGLPEGFDEAQLLSEVFLGSEAALLDRLVPALLGSGSNDSKAGTKLLSVEPGNLESLRTLESVLLFGGSAKSPFGAKIGSFPTKGLRGTLGDVMPPLEDLMARVEYARPRRIALETAQRTAALHDFARVFLPAYTARKQARGWLDFDDLIFKARDLLTDPTVAQWVLYRLDGGIDHILVDEAQDTSPVQWRVIELLSQEFTSGEGARAGIQRTIFVVGDKKQSIYSFQGADPREFDRMKAKFADRLATSNAPLQDTELAYSFRSSHAVLSLVDQVFQGRDGSGFQGVGHKAFKSEMPGRVDLWPAIEPSEKTPEDEDWETPTDRPGEANHNLLLARRIASEIRRMIDNCETIPAEIGHSGSYQRRPVQPGDFLILVRKRSTLFHELIRACKAQGLDIAGADRLKVGGELAVRDLAALMSFLATPEDDYALATALRSPLFGWTEQQLFTLAHHRGENQYLWQALRDQTGTHAATLSILNDLRDRADFMRPYDLIERILTRHDGRRNLLARLGAEAEDGINAFLSQALGYERSAVPSLLGFLTWMETDNEDIKRQMDSASNQIRVMTVHGAKGLEAPIVILPDTGKPNETNRDTLLSVDGVPFWKPAKDATPEALHPSLEDKQEAQAAERDRLLYVGLTRAEKWLIVALAGDAGKEGKAWYDQTANAMRSSGAGEQAFPFGFGLRLSHGDWDDLPLADLPQAEAKNVSVPAHFNEIAPVRQAPAGTLSPSDLGGAKALAGEEGLEEESAKRRGRQVHKLLEHLPGTPEPGWLVLAQTLLDQGEDQAHGPELEAIITEASSCLTNPGLAQIFAPDALAEVPVSAMLEPLNRRVHGIIDRLIIAENKVLAVDFKTNAIVPKTRDQVPLGLLRQMGAYQLALEQVFPGTQIETALLWTKTATLMPLPRGLVTDTLRDISLP